MKTPYDVIIIGAGPAGATAASILADNNFNTLILEKEKLPRTKICGGGVSMRALQLLKDLNIEIPKLKTFKPCDSMQVGIFDLNSVENLSNVKIDNTAAYLTDRAEFDYTVVKDAASKGTDLMENSKVKSIKKENSSFIVEGDDFSYKSKYLLCADGVNGISAKLLGFRDKWKRDEVGICIEANITDYKSPESPITFYFGGVKWGYAWLFDKGDHASIGTGTLLKDASNLNPLFESFIKNCEYIDPTDIKTEAWRIPATGGISGNFTKENALFLGDAAGLVDPFSGEGISYAIQSGKIASELIIANKIEDYSKIINKEITSDLKYARYLVNIVKLNPKMFAKLLCNDETIAVDWAKIFLGESTYKQFLRSAFKKVLTNPLKLF